MIADSILFCLKFLQINGRILRRNLHFIETKYHAGKRYFPSMAFFMVLILILQQKTIAPTYRFILPYRFFVVSEMQAACWEHAPQQAVFA